MSENITNKNKTYETSPQEMKKAYLVSVYKGNQNADLAKEHLEELELLTKTYGVEIAGKQICLVRRYDAATFITEGKLEEVLNAAKNCNANLLIFDDEIAPSQQRNLENLFKGPVMDRTGVILEVFAQRAQTKEAQLQIDLAKLKYQAPRLKRLWSHLSRQHGSGGAGGGAYLKGEGEKQIEIDRRILKKEIDTLNKEIKEVRENREMQRSSRIRSELPIFAIIGYTNAGKSTLLHALTDAKVLIEDKLFATLDTTTRKFTLVNNQDILLIDTVGFIRKLPHLLVAAFKSTLEEALHADILLHVVDVSHPMAEEQAQTSYEVLKELNAENKPVITVLNKIDQCQNPNIIQKMKVLYPKTVCISAKEKIGFNELQQIMIEELSRRRKIVRFRIPQKDYAKVSELMRVGNIIHQDYEENDVILRVDLPTAAIGRLQQYIEE
ncbi:GTP-binding protein HflX [Candidatus Rubidus massiliensis]|nr:GTP-binding protein HflX [Candidatus Rubidus massiliensis]